jgi:hypothetical protein
MRLKLESAKFAMRLLIGLVAVELASCAAFQPRDANGPRSNLPPYPVIASEPGRLEGATLAWQQLSQRYGLTQNTNADLEPLTGTLHSIPNNLGGSIFLPKVGGEAVQTEEETRESLRRFIVEWHSLIGADPDQLSLVERNDAGNLKVARYEQRPFRYPLRGGFGTLVIRFQADRRVIDVSSTCLPNTDRLQAALSGLTPKVTVENAAALVKEHAINVTGAGSQPHSFTLTANATIEVRQLVAYIKPSLDRQGLELHLAWEIDVTNGPIKTIYLDAISEQIIAVA